MVEEEGGVVGFDRITWEQGCVFDTSVVVDVLLAWRFDME